MPRNAPPTRTLRDRPDLNQLKRQAKELLDAFRAGHPEATKEVHAHYRQADPSTFALHDAQLVMARAHGFDSWPKLKAFVDGVTVRRLVEAVRNGDLAAVRSMVTARPELVHLDVAENDEHRALHHAVLRRRPGDRPLPDAARRRRAQGYLATSRRDDRVHARRRARLRRGRPDHRGGRKPPLRGRSAQGAATPGGRGSHGRLPARRPGRDDSDGSRHAPPLRREMPPGCVRVMPTA